MVLNRRYLIALAFAFTFGAATAPFAGEKGYRAVLGEDGLHIQPWFMDSFLDLKEDLAESAAAGKRLAIIWEQRGCPYCRETHRVNFAKPEIVDYIKTHFNVIQMNMWGDREVTDFDGLKISEKKLARRNRIMFTPTIQFFHATVAEVAGKKGLDAEAVRMPGYFKPFHFLSMFEYVFTNGYKDTPFQRWLQAKAKKMLAEGKKVDLW